MAQSGPGQTGIPTKKSIDTEKNKHPVGDVCEITAWGAKVRTLVIATDEELMIARDTKEVVENK